MCPVGEIPLPPQRVSAAPPHRRAHRAPEPTGPQAQSYATVKKYKSSAARSKTQTPSKTKTKSAAITRTPSPTSACHRVPASSSLRRRSRNFLQASCLRSRSAGASSSAGNPPGPGSHFPHQKPPDFQESPGCRSSARSSFRCPLAWGHHSTEYRIPKNFHLGTGNVRVLREKLVSKFESLATETNTYLETDVRSVRFGAEAFKEILAETKGGIRFLRDDIVQIMASIYNMGQDPLPPKEDLDADVSRILDDCCIATAACTATKSVASTSSTKKTTVSQSKSVKAKYKIVSAPLLTPPKSKAVAARLRVEVTSNARAGCEDRANATPKPRLISRGAAARARAEAAYDARARAEANARAEAVSRARAVARAAARARTEAAARARVEARAEVAANARAEVAENARAEVAARPRAEASAVVAERGRPDRADASKAEGKSAALR